MNTLTLVHLQTYEQLIYSRMFKMNSSYCWLDVGIQYDIETVPFALKLKTKNQTP